MASTSEEMDQVELEADAARPSDGPARGGQARARVSGPALRGSTLRGSSSGEARGEAFDDVTPTRSLAEVGLADMDEDLPTKMQTLDELARFRAAAADEAAPSPSPGSTARRDVLRPPPAIAPSEPPVFRSFPPPPGRERTPAIPQAPAVPSEAKAIALPGPEPIAATELGPEPIDRGTKILLVLSVVLMALAVSALVIERFVP